MTKILKLSAKEIIDLMANGEVSPLTVAVETFQQIKKSDLNAFITISEESGMSQAEISTKRIIKGEARRLEGLPIAIKDNFCSNQKTYPGVETTAGSKILTGFKPTYESTVTQRLADQGMVMTGKANMDEFAMGSSNEHSYFGPAKNPWNKACVPGGSSGGSAGAVAGYLSYAAIGSDTGGSVRCPAAFCGIVGVKPTYGRCSRFGMVPLASSFDQAGVFARSVEDACLVLDEIMGYCPKDSRSLNVPAPTLSNIQGTVSGMRIGYVAEHMKIVDDTVKEMWEKCLNILKENGADVQIIPMSSFESKECPPSSNPCYRWLAVYYTIQPIEAFSNFARYDGIKFGSYVDGPTLRDAYINTRDQFGDEVKKRLILGCNNIINDPEIFHKATSYRQVIKNEFDVVFKKFDAIVCPTMPHEAFKIGEDFKNPVNEYAEDIFTVLANIIGAPAISVPAGLGPTGMPLGIQVMCNRFEEDKMIRIAKTLERNLEFKKLGDAE